MDSIKKKTKNALIKGLRAAKRAEMRAERTLKRRLGYDVPVKADGGPYVHPWSKEHPGNPSVVDELDARHCCGCGSCAQSCPRGAITMEMDDEAWDCVRNTEGVTGFLGGNKPSPLSREDYNKMMRKSKTGDAPKRTTVGLEVDMPVKVTSGPLADFDGKIAEVNPEAGKVKVMLEIFGRETSVELGFDQIEVIS